MPFKHDSSGIDPDAPSILLLPDGWYKLKIMEAEEQVSSNGNDMILCKCGIVGEPQFADASIWHWVVFLPAKDKDGKPTKGAGMSVVFRMAIGVPFGGDDVVDADDWVGKRFMGFVVSEIYTNKETGKSTKRNKIQQLKSIEEWEKENAPAKPVANGKAKSSAVDEDVPF